MTGYTHQLISEDLNAKQFITICAQAFGAFVSRREEKPVVELPAIEVTSYHDDEIVKAKDKVSSLQAMSEAERINYGNQIAAEARERAKVSAAKRKAERDKLAAIREEIAKWTPPTPEHDGVKRFCLEQLDSSMPSNNLHEYEGTSGLDRWKQDLEYAQNDVVYHLREAAKARENSQKAAKWVEQLRDSLN